MKQIGIGLAGFGTVGAGVFKHLAQNRDLLSQRLGLELAVRRIAVRDPKKSRDVKAPAEIFTARWQDVVDDPNVQIVDRIEQAEAVISRPAASRPQEPLIEALTAREHDVLALVADGLPNREIARGLGISEHTVKFHLASIFGKLGVSTRTEAVQRGLRLGVIEI